VGRNFVETPSKLIWRHFFMVGGDFFCSDVFCHKLDDVVRVESGHLSFFQVVLMA
jgi:hypothetical protein